MCATILLAISDSQLTHICDCKTSNEIWQKLAKIYELKAFARKRYLCRMFCNLQMAEDDTMQQHISTLDDIVHQLSTISVNYPDDEIAMTLLDSLPESYDNLVITLEGMDDISSDYVKT